MKTKALIVFLVLAVVAAALYLLSIFGGEDLLKKAPLLKDITVSGYVGGEKINFLADQQVIDILKSRYGITVDGKKAGSIAMCTTLPTKDLDFLWPSNQVAAEMYHNIGGTSMGEEVIFNSPIVLYTWVPICDSLIKIGIVSRIKDSYFIVDFQRLIDMIKEQKTWAEIGLADLYGQIAIYSTDPTQSNSGNMFSGLLANMLNNGKVVTGETVQGLLPDIKGVFESLGYMPHSSGDIFQSFLNTGMGGRPIIVGYESQAIEFLIANLKFKDFINQKIRTLYPKPTVWSSHPLIALTGNGRHLLEALKDPDIQRLAWERHGFRSGLMGVQNDPSVLSLVGVAEEITSVIPMPDARTMTQIIGYLNK